ncbi:hypothetical protein [Pseudomonas sp. S2_F03]
MRDGNALHTELELAPFNWNTVLIVSGLCVAGIATAGLGLLAAAGYLFYAIYQGSQRKKLLVSDLNAYLEKLENQVASRIQGTKPCTGYATGPDRSFCPGRSHCSGRRGCTGKRRGSRRKRSAQQRQRTPGAVTQTLSNRPLRVLAQTQTSHR